MAQGAEAVALLDIAYRYIENQKAEIEQLYSLVYNVELQTEILTKVITRIEKQSFWQKVWAWIRGALVGGAIVVVVQEFTK